MTKRLLILASIAVAVLAAYSLQTAVAEKDTKEFKATCPVSGQPAKQASSLNYMRGKKVYFCCDNCPTAFKKDRKKFANKANQQLLQTGQIVQVSCPLTGRPMDKSKTVKVGTTSVTLCCGNCLGKANGADDKVAFLFATAKIRKGFTLQDKCPVSGKPISIEHAVTHKDQKVYFCCPNCPAKFEASPEKFTKKLPQFKQRKKKAKKTT